VTDPELMQSIKTKFRSAIADAVKPSAIPAEFLAALIANESGGDPAALRFEKGVLASLFEVVVGRVKGFGSIPRESVLGYVSAFSTAQDFDAAFQRLDKLASSHGLTQVMGYHILEKDLLPVPAADTNALSAVTINLAYSVALLEQFAKRFHLDERKDFELLFRCWNAGHPTGETADPAYVPKGLARLQIYQALP
jgi:hypothetical protein